MNTITSRLILVAASLFLLCGQPLFAQDQEEQPPSTNKAKPAGSTYPIPLVGSGDPQDQGGNNLSPDTTPLTGILNPTLGSPQVLHSYWMPGIQWSGSIQSNSYGQTQNNSSWLMNNYFIGNVSLLKAWPRSQLSLNYSAGGFVSTDSAQGNGYYQQLAFSQTFQWSRWVLQLSDQFSYLPESSFGFGGGLNTGLGNAGTGGSLGPVIPGVGNSYVPNQSIYGSVGPRYSNSSVVQLTYATSPRSSITMSGSYGLLNFVDPGNVDNDMVTGTVGYNYALNPHDTIGFFYRFSSYHFPGQPQALGDHSFNVAYGRKITGHIAAQFYAGPSFTTSRIATNGESSSYGVNAGANLQYGLENGSVSAGYSHGISGGSGVLTGTSTDQINVNFSHKLGRLWSGHLSGGYARNSSIGIVSSSSLAYNSYTFGGGFSRPLGPTSDFSIGYSANVPDYNTSGCTGSACGVNQAYQYITINLQWHARPFVLP